MQEIFSTDEMHQTHFPHTQLGMCFSIAFSECFSNVAQPLEPSLHPGTGKLCLVLRIAEMFEHTTHARGGSPHLISSPESFFGGSDVTDAGHEDAAERAPPESSRGQGSGVDCVEGPGSKGAFQGRMSALGQAFHSIHSAVLQV